MALSSGRSERLFCDHCTGKSLGVVFESLRAFFVEDGAAMIEASITEPFLMSSMRSLKRADLLKNLPGQFVRFERMTELPQRGGIRRRLHAPIDVG